jgi:mycoredoxin
MGEPAAIVVQVYWRPGCPYYRRLRRALRGIDAQWHNIWADVSARSFVRQANRGDETVPTVRVGQRVLTNPTGDQVAALLPTQADDDARTILPRPRGIRGGSAER